MKTYLSKMDAPKSFTFLKVLVVAEIGSSCSSRHDGWGTVLLIVTQYSLILFPVFGGCFSSGDEKHLFRRTLKILREA